MELKPMPTRINYAKLSKQEQEALHRRFPSVFWEPNIAQSRPLSRWKSEMPSRWPRVHLVTFGNRTGKTDFLGEFLCGAAKGNRWVNKEYARSPFFKALQSKRDDETLTIWWVCEGELMKENGPDYKAIKKHIPDAKFSQKSNNGVFRQIRVPILKSDRKTPGYVTISVKTHDMETTAFAGDNVDLIICDEPPPQEKWGEMSGRMVNLKGDVGGRIIIGATPLKIAGYLGDIVEDAETQEDGRVVHDEGSIWENCAGDELPEEQAKRLGIPWDAEKKMWATRGHLSSEGIENAIKNWEKSGDPDEVVARTDGKFTHVQGRIYKVFTKKSHVIVPFDIPKTYPVVQICDPHDARPDAAAWFAVTPNERWVGIAEYPLRPFWLITSRDETIAQTCESWRKIEEPFKHQIALRIGDPNKMNDPDPATNLLLKELYAQHPTGVKGKTYRFNTNVIDKIETGHELVRQAIWCDREKLERFPNEPMYRPRLTVFETCQNLYTYMMKYTRKAWRDPSKPMPTKLDEAWKDYADLVRYFVMKMSMGGLNYHALKALMEGHDDDEWNAIKSARCPNVSSNSGDSRHVLTGPRVPVPTA
jgi:hypothetical protein